MTTNENPAGDVLVLKLDLLWTSPPIWRELRVRADTRLSKLHRIFQTAMGWRDAHLHEFRVDGVRYGPRGDVDDPPNLKSEKTVRLVDLALPPGGRFEYLYDFGDGWRHAVTVTATEPEAEAEPRAVCTGGARACPPEDSGGPPGYADILAILADRRSSRHREVRRWVGGAFDPAAFDLAAVNARLAEIR
jgi:hypothetical protein